MTDNCCENNCIAEILKVILILQQSVSKVDSCMESCDRGFLGQQCSTVCYNTRPIVLYDINGNAFSMPISKDPSETTTSSICRLEKLDSCCATCRVLSYSDTNGTYTATNSFFTINLNSCACIRCLDDVYVDLCN